MILWHKRYLKWLSHRPFFISRKLWIWIVDYIVYKPGAFQILAEHAPSLRDIKRAIRRLKRREETPERWLWEAEGKELAYYNALQSAKEITFTGHRHGKGATKLWNNQ